MPDLEKRLKKKKMKATAKAERKNIKSKGKNQDAVNKGYSSQAAKNRATTESIAKVRSSKKTKGPKSVRYGDKSVKIDKSSGRNVTSGSGSQSGAASGSRSGATGGAGGAGGKGGFAKQKQKQNQNTGGTTPRGDDSFRPTPKKPTPTPKKPTPTPKKPRTPMPNKPDNRLDVGQGRPFDKGFGGSSMKTGGMVNPNMRSMSEDAAKAYKSNKMRRNMPKGY